MASNGTSLSLVIEFDHIRNLVQNPRNISCQSRSSEHCAKGKDIPRNVCIRSRVHTWPSPGFIVREQIYVKPLLPDSTERRDEAESSSSTSD